MLLYTNTTLHKNIAVRRFLTKKCIAILCNYFLFLEFKLAIKRIHYAYISKIVSDMTAVLNKMLKIGMELKKYFQILVIRFECCNAAEEAYFE